MSKAANVEHGRGQIRDNALQALVTSKLFQPKVVRAKKGKGSYKRKGRNNKDYALFAFSLLLSAFCAPSLAQVAGGQSGYDQSLDAITPTSGKMSISLAGETPVDISRFILADNNGAGGAQPSPDGKHIAFSWSITGQNQLWLVPATGGLPTQLTYGNGISFFRWAPDGNSLIYGADNDGNEQPAFYRISKDGQQETLLLAAQANAFRRFGDFIDNDHIVFSSTERTGLDFDIYEADTRNNKIKRLVEGKYGYSARALSPNGQYIVISETVGEDSDNLYLYDRKKGRLTTLSAPQRRANHTDAGIAWANDSSGFYLASNLDRNFTALMFYSLEGEWQLLHEANADIDALCLVGKDKTRLAFSENHGGYSRLAVMDLKQKTLINAPQLPEGVYRFSCAHQSNTLAIHVDNWQTPGDLYTWDIDSNRLYSTFTAAMAGINKADLIKPVSLTIPARDGVMLHGLLYMPPPDKVVGDKPPVVFNVHGGPTAQSRPRFNPSAQYLLGRGIAVFLPNVRGSTGFGHTYVTLDDRENRLHSIRDLVDMLAFFEKEGRLDTQRAAVVGGSYGGYAVNAVLANFPGHFSAGVSLFGVADWVTALQVASPDLKAADRIEYGDINDPKWLAFYSEQSPLRQADNIRVPVLYSHGAMDPRIDIAETEIMVKTLRQNGVDAPYIRFLDEGHGWRKLKNRLFYAREEAKFLEQQFGLRK